MWTALDVRGHSVMTAGSKRGDGRALFGRIKFRNKLLNWPWNWGECKSSMSQLGHCMLANKFPTEFASNLCLSWMIFQGEVTGKGVCAAVRDMISYYADSRGKSCCFGLHPNFLPSHFLLKCDFNPDDFSSKTRGLCSNVELTGCEVCRRNAPWVQKVKWQKGGNIEQEEREWGRAAGCSVHLFLNESRGSRKGEVRGGTNDREKDRKDWIDVSANVN